MKRFLIRLGRWWLAAVVICTVGLILSIELIH
ncbi:hypothetical protein B0G76_8602 [Paraburkholderia sp. BL23I1N1]|nr:hypothetical protein B0G76_8602 [Paraburkholderia sp. BL23I1N1]